MQDMEVEKRRILGVDPGTNIMGYAVLDVCGRRSDVVVMDVVKMAKLPAQADKLKMIFTSLDNIIEEYSPDILAIEEPFFGKNPQSMLKLGRAQGVAMAAALAHGLEIFEYPPRRIKQAITGVGSASKEQVAAMLKALYPDIVQPDYFDATDALAAAVCHHLQSSLPIIPARKSGWKAFLSQHSDRIISNNKN